MSIEYHLGEMEIAQSPDHAAHILPKLRPTDQTILDIGCGIGQTLIALNCPERRRIGIDIDSEAIRYSKRHYPELEVYEADATSIPLEQDSVDLVIMRVSLPYMNIPVVTTEVRRVLREGGRVWMTLHSRKQVSRFLRDAIRERDVKDAIHKSYVLANGLLFKLTGCLIPFVNGLYESWQDIDALKRYFSRRGFSVRVGETKGKAFIEATLS